MAKAARRSTAAVATAAAATTNKAAPVNPAVRPDWTKMLDQKHSQEYAGVKLRYLEKFDRVGLSGLLTRNTLGAWLAKQAHQAAVLHERLERGGEPAASIEKQVAALLTPQIETQQTLPPTIETELVKLLQGWKAGEGKLFTSL